MIDKQALKILFNNRTQKKDYQLSSLDNQQSSFFFFLIFIYSIFFYSLYIYKYRAFGEDIYNTALGDKNTLKMADLSYFKKQNKSTLLVQPPYDEVSPFFRQCFDYDFYRYTLIVLQAPYFRLHTISCAYAIPPSSYLTRLRRAIPPVCFLNQCTQNLGLGICGHSTNLSH